MRGNQTFAHSFLEMFVCLFAEKEMIKVVTGREVDPERSWDVLKQ